MGTVLSASGSLQAATTTLRLAVRRRDGRPDAACRPPRQPGRWRTLASAAKGMRVRLTFARSLINDPRSAVPRRRATSGLDPVNARKDQGLIVDLKARGRTIFLTTHGMATADELCDQVAFVGSRIVALDSPHRTERSLAAGGGCRSEYRGRRQGTQEPLGSADSLADDPAFHFRLLKPPRRDHS